MKSLLLLILLLAPAAKLQSASVPNIAFIIADDLGVSDTGFMGNPDVRTPALDAFAARSTIFERLYVASPEEAQDFPRHHEFQLRPEAQVPGLCEYCRAR